MTANPSRPAATPGEHDSGAPSHEAGAALVSRSESREYGPDGLVWYGPQRARPALVWLIADVVGAPPAPIPSVARAQQSARKSERRRILARHARFLAAIAGDAVGRNRGRAA
jgi:hypothetical protein